ncbi:MAG TPA: UDP-glucose 4-epimerase GalE [Candidatus Nanoperiomorbaceae bacterium]|nr:MAG: UDP-glucose 4-epimerase GalE [Candidatus Saccharibacteria bacterium]HMQ09453.1 UDP-glucose 4-epimerase GalE [Candidatus Nanoperiomorbaceae bacterium]HMQ96882.1 UDP-glucose 4-epimerase GalE [Candidatus Nanoperiomorbaceae bacterium]HMR86278.1 UDP-glucose 4-epimerase GalE [Candidatus Nanoperiomorbaceae bacterium]
MKLLVTGGAGYIGSHTVVELLTKGHDVVVIDNLSNSSREAIKRVEEITGKSVEFHEADVRDREALDTIFAEGDIDAIIHFAGLKAVGESVEKPLMYYENNIDSTLVLIEAMQASGVKKLVFSSSATVYGSAPIPYSEDSVVGQGITNPYGRTKYFIEEIIRDVTVADPTFEGTILRYFNPIGAHPSGRIGEDPSGIPNNLMPYITQVATGRREKLNVFGGDYETVDGTGVRDYIHVDDLAAGHVAAIEHSKPGFEAYNLGSGVGVSVLELVHAFEKASGQDIPYEIVDRRAGDLPEFYARADKAREVLGWSVQRSLEDACADSWRWQSQNPHGY